MGLHMVPHLPRMVVKDAKFSMSERKVDNLIYYFSVILLLFISLFRSIETGWLQTICFINFYICRRKVSNSSCIKIQYEPSLSYVK